MGGMVARYHALAGSVRDDEELAFLAIVEDGRLSSKLGQVAAKRTGKTVSETWKNRPA